MSERSYLHEVDVRDGPRDIIVVFVRSVPDDDVAPGGEEAADERWGGQDDYEAYKKSTPVLVMKPPAR